MSELMDKKELKKNICSMEPFDDPEIKMLGEKLRPLKNMRISFLCSKGGIGFA